MSRSKDSPCSTYVELRCAMPRGCPDVPASILCAPRWSAELEALGDREEDVVGLGLADAHAHPLPRERAHRDAGLLGQGHELGGPLPQGQPDEVALRFGEDPAAILQPGDD